MKILNILIRVIISTFFTSATPNLFGSVKRRKAKEAIANEYKEMAEETQSAIDETTVANPFESASAKSAMTASNKKAREVQKRFANVMGGNSNPESMVAAQQATQEAVSGTAGDIAVGAEAQKKIELAQLRGEKMTQLNTANEAKQAAANERGSGWRDFYSVFMNPLAGGIKGGASATASS